MIIKEFDTKQIKIIYVWSSGVEEVLNIKQVFNDAGELVIIVENINAKPS
jgi:hypothetical protein